MKGLYKGKYLIGLYDKEDYPLFIADNAVEFIKAYRRLFGVSDRTRVYRSLKQLRQKNCSCYENTKFKAYLIEADDVTHDCFEDADKDFINFISDNRKKTNDDIAAEMGISLRTFYRRKAKGKIKIPSEDCT